MKKYCEECGKKLSFLCRYNHPLKKKKTVCGKCLDWILQGIKNYKRCLKEGKQHNINCYFWDEKNHKCKNEKYFKKDINKRFIGGKNASKNI